ncbi:MAG: hypothetical protein R3358_01605 [Woeseiaceae bacterium]|nr:hypothetical protein [Woeseiaceae bacterium]
MERLLQYWDDLDDLVGALYLCYERIRRVVLFTLYALVVAASQIAVVLLALERPPLALAAATILLVTLMYRSVTAPGYSAPGA